MQIAASMMGTVHAWGGGMGSRDNSLVMQQATDQRYADLEAELVSAVADFGLDELKQMVDTAEAIRRVRRM
jgi:hypothetical protein